MCADLMLIKKTKRKIGKLLFQPYGEILMFHSVVEKKNQLEVRIKSRIISTPESHEK